MDFIGQIKELSNKVSEWCSNSNYELEFCLAHTISILYEYLTLYKIKK